jgi:prevent-host-death family protein
MVRAGMHEAKSGLSRLVQQALDGEDVVITRHGRPVVRLVPVEEEPRTLARCRGAYAGRIWMADDFDDFTPEIAELFGIE